MNRKPNLKTRNEIEPQPARRVSKKDQIISLRDSGVGGIKEIATITGAQPSYVASVLQSAGLLAGYFDHYTTTANPMNVYSMTLVLLISLALKKSILALL